MSSTRCRNVARFEVGATSILTTAVADAPLIAIRAPATEVLRITEIGISLVTAVASRLKLIRALAVSVTPTGNLPLRPTKPGAPNSGSTFVTGWTTAPTVTATSQLRQVSLPATIGAGFVWSWPADRPLEVGLGSAIAEILIANIVAVAPGIFDLWVCCED